jgi:L-ascorbate metabolism protein UlaG (beta-lactamase superfamily)
MQGNPWKVTKELYSGPKRKPESPLPVIRLTQGDFAEHPAALQAVWLGHSSMIVEIEGKRILIDPVLDKYAAPVRGVMKRFQPAAITREQLPHLDAVIISHNHYDHLEVKTVKHLAARGIPFLTALGVGSYLESWGIAPDLISEFDWWESTTLDRLEITAVPSQHFSGRGMFDRNKSLWAGWTIKGGSHSVYFSSDGGWGTHFEEIGSRLGPFDLTIMETGAYSRNWPFIHIEPERAVDAHIAAQGKSMLPVHWGTFDLSLHRWDEPANRASAYAKEKGVHLLTPHMGQFVIPGETETEEWWTAFR